MALLALGAFVYSLRASVYASSSGLAGVDGVLDNQLRACVRSSVPNPDRARRCDRGPVLRHRKVAGTRDYLATTSARSRSHSPRGRIHAWRLLHPFVVHHRCHRQHCVPRYRRSVGAAPPFFNCASAPFGLALAQRGLSLNFTNQSEISSFVLLGPFALLQMQRLHIRGFTHRWRLLLVGLAGVFLLLAMWYLISSPPVSGRPSSPRPRRARARDSSDWAWRGFS